MTYNEKTRDYSLKYAKDHLKRVPLDIPTEEYDRIKAAAESAGESINGYIKSAVRSRMESES